MSRDSLFHHVPNWPRPGDDDHVSAFDGTLADGLDDEGDRRFHKAAFVVDGSLRSGRYLGTPVLVVRDDGDGFVVALWPDRIKPGRSHGKDKPFTFNKAEWWRLWPNQITESDFDYEAPEFPMTLEPKPLPTDDGTRQ